MNLRFDLALFEPTLRKSVNAYRLHEYEEGVFVCDEQEIGPGVRVSERITSGEVPDPDLTCSPTTELFFYENIKLNSGKTVIETQREILDYY